MQILITAGPTREPIDPVRYITNRSSGKMGYALAEEAARQGHRVMLISGPTQLDVPDGVDYVPVETADEMYEAVGKYCHKAHLCIMCAAVADYKMSTVLEQKMKKSAETLTLELVRTRDILGSMRSAFDYKGYLVGFAAETQNIIDYARGKLISKHCDLIVANDVSQAGIGFNSDENEVTLVFADGQYALPKASKHEIAHHIVDQVVELATQGKHSS